MSAGVVGRGRVAALLRVGERGRSGSSERRRKQVAGRERARAGGRRRAWVSAGAQLGDGRAWASTGELLVFF
jgi:hypothetical protein